jgi:hypothetical protein
VSEILAPPQSEVDTKALAESHGLTQKAAAVVYFSFAEPDSFVGVHDPGGRITRLIEFLPLPVRGADLLEAIASIDENGPRLLANYRQAFPELYDGFASFSPEEGAIEVEALAWLLGASSLILGLEEPDLVRALLPAPGGVKVDTVVIEQEGHYRLDGRRLLRSVMSYRIAGVPRDILARSVFESLGDFAADAVRRLLKDWKAEAIVCAGDLFAANNILRLRTRGAMISLRLPMYFPAVGGNGNVP